MNSIKKVFMLLATFLCLTYCQSLHAEHIQGLGDVEIHPTYQSIGIQITVDKSFDLSTPIEMDYQLHDEKSWLPGMDLTISRDKQTLITSILNCQAGQAYNIRLTVASKSHVMENIRTRAIKPLSQTSVNYYVSPTGSDEQMGTREQPFKTISHALAQSKPDCTINVLPGRYPQTLLIRNMQATKQKPLIIRSVQQHKAVIDSSVKLSQNKVDWRYHAGNVYTLTVDKPVEYLTEDGYWCYRYPSLVQLVRGYPDHSQKVPEWKRSIPRGWFYDKDTRKLYVQVTDRGHPAEHTLLVTNHAFGFELKNSQGVIIDGFTICNNSIAAVGISENTDDVRVMNNLIHHNGIGVSIRDNTSDNNLVYRNTIYATGVLDYDWTLVKHGNCLCKGLLVNAGRGNSIIQNDIFGLFDGIQVVSWHTQQDRESYNADSDILGNVVRHCLDDGIEPDGGGVNMRIVGNHISNINMSGISLAPIASGPVYVIRNVQYNSGWTAFKFNVGGKSSNGITHIYHNSAFGTQMAMCLPPFPPKGVTFENKFIMNNAFVVTRYGIYNGHGKNLIDHNCYWKLQEPHTPPMFWDNGQKEFVRLDDFTSLQRIANAEPHGMIADPQYANPQTGDFTPMTSSALIDQAQKIRGINDHYTGRAPDIGAVEYATPVTSLDWVTPIDFPLGKGKLVQANWKIKSGIKDKNAIRIVSDTNTQTFTVDFLNHATWGYAVKPITGTKFVDEQIHEVNFMLKGDGSETTIGFFIMTDQDSFTQDLSLADSDWHPIKIPLQQNAFKDINSEGTGKLEIGKVKYIGFYFKGNVKASFSIKDDQPKMFSMNLR